MKQKKFLKFIVFLVITLSIVKLLIAGLISTSGFALFNIKNETSMISTENQNLREEIVANSSFKNIQAKAENIGLKSVNMVVNYSVTRSPIAMKE
jgi:hypothetical protein